MNKAKKAIGNNYKYKITDVKETGNKSIISMDVEYEVMNYEGEQFKNIALELEKQYGNDLNEEIVDKIMEKYTDFLIVKKNIKVIMNKENNYWTLDFNENPDFLVSLYSRGELYFYHI